MRNVLKTSLRRTGEGRLTRAHSRRMLRVDNPCIASAKTSALGFFLGPLLWHRKINFSSLLASCFPSRFLAYFSFSRRIFSPLTSAHTFAHPRRDEEERRKNCRGLLGFGFGSFQHGEQSQVHALSSLSRHCVDGFFFLSSSEIRLFCSAVSPVLGFFFYFYKFKL